MRDRSTQRKLPGASAKHSDLDALGGASWRASVKPYDQPSGMERSLPKAIFGLPAVLRSKGRAIAAVLLPPCGVTTELPLKSIDWQLVLLSVNPFRPLKTS